ncbi:MAG: hypothetical protein RLZZ08_1439 [Pseudomonadota bacterium]|jgi:hypothetical protein
MSDTGNLVGGCLCGALRYRINGNPLFVSQCCCKDCQKATGTGHTTIIGIHKDQLAMQGDPATFTNSGDTGGKVTRHFCGTCGGRLYTSGDAPGDHIMVQAGSLDDPNQVSPQNVIYVKDRLNWDFVDPALPQFPALPDRVL